MSKGPKDRERKAEGSGNEGRPGLGGRIIFWALLIYTFGLAVMVIEDMLTHTLF